MFVGMLSVAWFNAAYECGFVNSVAFFFLLRGLVFLVACLFGWLLRLVLFVCYVYGMLGLISIVAWGCCLLVSCFVFLFVWSGYTSGCLVSGVGLGLLVRFAWFGFVSLTVLGGRLWAVYLLVLVALFGC